MPIDSRLLSVSSFSQASLCCWSKDIQAHYMKVILSTQTESPQTQLSFSSAGVLTLVTLVVGPLRILLPKQTCFSRFLLQISTHFNFFKDFLYLIMCFLFLFLFFFNLRTDTICLSKLFLSSMFGGKQRERNLQRLKTGYQFTRPIQSKPFESQRNLWDTYHI